MYDHNVDDLIEQERLPLELRNVDIAELLKENPSIMKDMFNGHKVNIPLHKCPDCRMTMPEEVKHLHKCKKANGPKNNNTSGS